MPHSFSMLDTQFPHFSGDESTDAKIEGVQDYLFMLLENLKYSLFNLGQDNFNAAELETIKNWTISGISNEIRDIEGNLSALLQTTESIELRVSDAEGDISTLTQTASGLTSRISDAEGDISLVSQTADKINWIVDSGSSEANFTLTPRTISLVASQIDLTGFVTFSALSTSGQTIINGSNITTGKIDARYIDVDSLEVRSIYNESGNSVIYSYNRNIYIGNFVSAEIDYIRIKASTSIEFTTGLVALNMTSSYFGPESSSSNYDLGQPTRPWKNLYAEIVTTNKITATGANTTIGSTSARWGNIYATDADITNLKVYSSLLPNGTTPYLGNSLYKWRYGYITEINATDLNVDDIYIGGTYGIVADGNVFRPASASTYNPAYLGNSSYYWQYAYLGSVETRIGSGTTSKLGFFGATPQTRKTVSSAGTVADVITALKSYGLFG